MCNHACRGRCDVWSASISEPRRLYSSPDRQDRGLPRCGTQGPSFMQRRIHLLSRTHPPFFGNRSHREFARKAVFFFSLDASFLFKLLLDSPPSPFLPSDGRVSFDHFRGLDYMGAGDYADIGCRVYLSTNTSPCVSSHKHYTKRQRRCCLACAQPRHSRLHAFPRGPLRQCGRLGAGDSSRDCEGQRDVLGEGHWCRCGARI